MNIKQAKEILKGKAGIKLENGKDYTLSEISALIQNRVEKASFAEGYLEAIEKAERVVEAFEYSQFCYETSVLKKACQECYRMRKEALTKWEAEK